MNKSELVSRLTDRLGGDRTVATTAVNGVLEEIVGSVARGERVSLIGFGTFDRRERAARIGRNPQTGATLQLAASVTPVFRPAAGFRSLLGSNTTSTASAPVVEIPRPAPAADDAPRKKAAKKAAKKKTASAGPTRAVALNGKAAKKAAKKAAGKKSGKAAKKGR
jgi:DNA-binding protein HU-beta